MSLLGSDDIVSNYRIIDKFLVLLVILLLCLPHTLGMKAPDITSNGPTDIHERNDSVWRTSGNWKARYSKLYSSRRLSIPEQEETQRISFIGADATSYSDLLLKLRERSDADGEDPYELLPADPSYILSIMSRRSDLYNSLRGSAQSQSLGRHDTMLLDMVRGRSQEAQLEAQEVLDLPKDDASDDLSSEPCVHGLSLRFTERSVSRSRMSRVSTRRDMDIPSILAFTTNPTPPKAQIEIPAFQMANIPKPEPLPKWSIRRASCPVCSQKWRDRSTIEKIKHSGLKRNFSDFPSVIAPARLRTSIILSASRPGLTLDDDLGLSRGGLRSNSASWQLTRARRFRLPKLQLPPPEATAPLSITAPLARKDLDTRVYKFLTT